MEKLKKLFNKLQIDSKSMLFTVEQLNQKGLNKIKRTSYVKDKEFFNLFLLLENKDDFKGHVCRKRQFYRSF